MPKALTLTLLMLLAGALALYAAVLAWLWFKQESLMFYPVALPSGHRLATQPGVTERTVAVRGAQLSVLHLQLPDPKGLVFFLHGNAGNLAGWFSNANFYRDADFDLVMPDYRGFGKSTGHIGSADELRQDVRAVWDTFAAQYRGRRIVLYGRSLGTALAADLAEQLTGEGRAPDLTVLVSPYTSMRDLTREFYPWVPAGLLRYPLDTARHLPKVGGPVLLVHGENDALIGVAHAQRLQQVHPLSRLLVVPGAGHNDIQESRVYRDVLRQALAAL